MNSYDTLYRYLGIGPQSTEPIQMLFEYWKIGDMLQKHVQGKFCSLGNHIEWITIQSGLTFTSICGCFMVAAKSNLGLSNMKRPRRGRLVFFKLSITFEVTSNIYLCSQHSAPVPPLDQSVHPSSYPSFKNIPFSRILDDPHPFQSRLLILRSNKTPLFLSGYAPFLWNPK